MNTEPWQDLMREAVRAYIDQTVRDASPAHTGQTPNRVVSAYAEFVSGYEEDPQQILSKTFEDSIGCSGMVHCWYIPVVSMCAHHIMPFTGLAHFAYVPFGRVVGLSKIPRFIDVLCRRLQIQENLGEEIVTFFQTEVAPYGCAVTIDAEHHCMSSRGARVHGTVTTYTAYRGSFKEGASRLEFESARPPKI